MQAIVLKILSALLFLIGATPTLSSNFDSAKAHQIRTRDLSSGEHQTASVYLFAGQYLGVCVAQEGIDVSVALQAPEGKRMAEVNRPIGAHGPEFLHWIAEASGTYTIEVFAANRNAQAGRYSLMISTPHMAQANDVLRVTAQQALIDGRGLCTSGDKLQIERAIEVFASAANNFANAGDVVGQADALIEQGQTHLFLGQAKAAEPCFEHARELYHQVGEPHGEILATFKFGVAKSADWQKYFHQTLELARTHHNRFLEAKALREIGYDIGLDGNHHEGIGFVRDALKIQCDLGYRYDEAEARLSLGWMLNDLGDLQAGTTEYLTAAQIHREDNNRRELANALLFVSEGWLLLRDVERAQDAVAESLGIARTGGYQSTEILALLKYSDVYLKLEQPRDALRQLEIALPLAEQNNYQVLRVLKRLGQARLALGQYQQALDYLDRAYSLYQKQGLISGRADVNFYLAQVYERLGQFDQAQTEYERTLTDFQQRDERLGVARTLIAQTRLQASQNKIDAASERNAMALTLLESLRKGLASYAARTTFFATLAEAYAQQIDLLMRHTPSNEHIKTAFAVSERARARALLEMVAEAHQLEEGQTATALLKELYAAQQRLNEAALQRLAASANSAPLDARLRELAANVEAARTRLRTAHPRYADLTQPQTLDVAAVQGLLDPDSLLLEYALGEERSYVWAVTADGITGYTLPKRAELDAAARKFYELLKTNKPTQTQAAALSQIVLGPVAAQLGKRRLLIVADGALQYVPFAVLPQPQTAGRKAQPLLESNEIVSLPSASVLAVLRREAATRQRAPQTVAVFADPVFNRQDARVRPGAATAPVLTAEIRRGGELQRVLTARDEADKIAALAPDAAFVARDFDANRAAILQTDLRSYRILHFATHGWFDDTHPDLSWLAFSMVDKTGEPRDGYLRLHEIYNLKLNAELVVLSACETALGKEAKGEGLLGLTRGFMYAGTPRVVASLWKVDGDATSNLMQRFYDQMLHEGRPPAAALHAAQLKIKKQWPNPYYWGAFVLQGDWR